LPSLDLGVPGERLLGHTPSDLTDGCRSGLHFAERLVALLLSIPSPKMIFTVLSTV
jgi:hypothetical protein